MEQRPLRLGDIVDDYCPRERRLTNHVVVALVGDAIRQTRCSTCDTEHVYKEARVPKRKKKDDTAALYDQVLAEASPAQPAPPRPQAPASATEPPPQAATAGESPAAPDPEAADDDRSNGHHDLWPAHRRLIRASLPRTENDPPVPRPIPEFTMHQRQPQHRGGGFRHGQGQGQGHGHGQWQGNGQSRFGAGHGRPHRPGPAGDEPNGNVPPGQGKGRRRSRRGGKHRRPR